MMLLRRLPARSCTAISGGRHFACGDTVDKCSPASAFAHTFSGRSYGTAAPARLHFCVVGAGPAGFYTADKVMVCMRTLLTPNTR